MIKITIDENTCLKHKMTLQEFLIALAIRSGGFENCIENLIKREVLVDDKEYLVTQHWSDVIDEILADSAGEQDEKRLENLAKQMRELYPEGRMIDKRTGQLTSYYFRSNPKEIAHKLKTFFMRYGNFSDEDILDAERRYVASYRGNYQQRGFRLLKYFIFKDDVKQGPDGNYVEPVSPLYDFLVNKESDEGVVVNTDEWTSRMI